MENAVRVIITVFFIGLIALAVILFAVFGLIPLGQAGKIFNSGSSSSSVEVVVVDPNPQTEPEQNTPPSGNTNEGSSEEETNVNEPPTESNPNSPEENNPPEVIPPEQESVTPTPEPPKVIRLDAPPGSSEAPQQSSPVSEENLPAGAIHIVTKGGGLSIREFTVREGEEMTLAFTSADGNTHVFAFRESGLSAVAIGVGPGETRTMTFNAPPVGTYYYFCNVPGHGGETGTMIVE